MSHWVGRGEKEAMKSRVTLEEHIEEQAKSGYYNDCKMGTQANGTFSGPVPLWIDGKEVTTSTTFDVDSPTNSQKLWTSSSASVKEAQQACEAAQKAFKPWSKTKPGKIWQILTKAADILEARKEEAAKYMMEETGALRPFADFNITTTIDNLRDVAGRPADIHGIIPPTKADGQAALVFKEPYGAILGMLLSAELHLSIGCTDSDVRFRYRTLERTVHSRCPRLPTCTRSR